MRIFITASLIIFQLLSFSAIAQHEGLTNEMRGKVAVITGSSSGLGLELTKLAIANEMHLVLVDINPEVSNQVVEQYLLDGGKAVSVHADLSDPTQRSTIIEGAINQFGKVDYLFNNAGYAYMSSLADHDMAEAKRLFEVNYWAYVDLSQRALPHMIKNGRGHIINTVSVLGVIPGGAQMGPYAATKHALVGFFQSTATELKGSGVHVKLVCPGGMKTNIIPNARGKYVDQMQHVDDNWEPPVIVAKQIFENLHDGKILQYPSIAEGMYKQYLQTVM
jgi:short-subunit dehydrogenase